ncbi:MAG: DUF4143 domain-containing protein [Holosporaceae bacterium]|nr:DUF4143 domain-containing protein [Holosporaceae bacterium]
MSTDIIKNHQKQYTHFTYFYDTGVLCNLLGIKSTDDLNLHFAYVSIFENFVLDEILKSQCNNGARKNIYFLRDAKGHEIDCLTIFGRAQ